MRPVAPQTPLAAAEAGVTVVRARAGGPSLDLAVVWAYRELLYFLVWRDVKVRYKQTVLGGAWAVIQPFVTMVVFSVFFGTLARVPSNGLPYPVFAFAALVPWTFVTLGVTQAASSLVGSQNLLQKVYFPRLVIPIAAVMSGLVDFAIAFLVLLGLMLYFAIPITITAVAVIPLLALAMTTALGLGLWLSAANVRYRDVRLLVPFLIQVWLFATPVAYPSSLLAEPWRTVYGLNPMVGVVEGFRWALLGGEPLPAGQLILSTAVALLVLVSGAYYFRRTEATFADVV